MPATDMILTLQARDRDMQQTVTALCEKGFTATLARDAAEVILKANKGGCGLLICPQFPLAATDGMDLCLQLHAVRRELHPPVLLFLETIDLQQTTRALQVGVDALLPFGCPESAVLAHVRRLLQPPPAQGVDTQSLDMLFGEAIISTPLPAERALHLALSALAWLSPSVPRHGGIPAPAEQSSREPASQTASPEVLDSAKTLARLRGDAPFLSLLYQTFLKDLDNRILSMRSSLEKGDLEGLCKLAHSLKGAAATIDALAVRELSFQTEIAAREGDAQRCEQCLNTLSSDLEVLKNALLSHLNHG